jgi:succinate dehydrogenase/fumarate reductase flavoprotein subunit
MILANRKGQRPTNIFSRGTSGVIPLITNACMPTGGVMQEERLQNMLKKIPLSEVNRKQIDEEKKRIYAPLRKKDGIEWKELNAGISRIMQNYCGNPKSGELLKIGLMWLEDIEENVVPEVYAADPHKLGRTLDVLDLLTCCQAIVHACLARKASSKYLDFNRIDYPEKDPPSWHKWITIKLKDGKIVERSLPIDFWGSLNDNYEIHNRDYKGWYNK